MFQPKFKIKNKTRFPIYVKMTNKKMKLEPLINARPGLTGEAVRMTEDIIGKKVTKWWQKVTDKLTDQVFDLDHQHGSNEEKREYHNQRDRLVLNMSPINQDFKVIRPGQSYRSSKLRQSIESNSPWFLTVLTKQFLQETSPPAYPEVSAGCARLNLIPPGEDVAMVYNVPHANTKMKSLHGVAKLVVEDRDGLIVVRKVLAGQQGQMVVRVSVEREGEQGT